MSDLVLVTDPGGPVATVTVNRPSALNALDAATLEALVVAFGGLAGTPGVRCVILTGAGEKAFVAGADIKAMANMTPAEASTLAELSHRLGALIAGMPAPVIAAVNGFALGGGCELALCCDFIYASTSAKFGQPEVGLGVVPGLGGTQLLPRRIGLARASELLFTGAIIDAQEALRLGLANAVVEPAALMPRVRAVADAIVTRAPLAVAAAKRAARDGVDLPLAGGLELERRLFAGLFATADQKEGMRAFIEKRAVTLVRKVECRMAGMDLELTAEQALLRDTARELATKEILPRAAELDRAHAFPREIIKRLGEVGLMGVMVPEAWGGAGMDAVSYALALEEISRACASTGVIMSVQNSLVCAPLVSSGTDAQRARWLPDLATGKKIGCSALSEPEAGSDAAAQRTTATRKGDAWVLSGTKNFITNAPAADLMLVAANTTPGKGTRGISIFLVPTGTPGVKLGKPDDKLGIRAAVSCQVFLEDVAVGADALLGPENEGFKIAMRALDGGRIGIAAQAVGIARAAFEDAVRYAQERKTFGQRIADHQAIQFKLADMCTEIDAARLLLWRAAVKKDAGARYSREAAMAKLFASEVANRAAKEALQVFGGYGYLGDFPAERHFRDAKITEIYEGTSEIQRLVIASSLLKD